VVVGGLTRLNTRFQQPSVRNDLDLTGLGPIGQALVEAPRQFLLVDVILRR
jgi:hypothetical protein